MIPCGARVRLPRAARQHRVCHRMASPSAALDSLSPAARQALKFEVGQAYRKLVVSGSGNSGAKQLLASLQPENVLAAEPARRDDAAAVLAGLWLWHDWLDESHRLSQNIHSATG